MAGNKVTINLTDEQQKQIKNATGKSIRELNLDLEAMGSLSEKDLQEVVGGYRPSRKGDGTTEQYF